MKETTKDIILILLVSILIRVLPFINYLFNPKYIFNNSITPYFYKFDSWFYAGILNYSPKFIIFILPFILSMIGLVYIYFTMKELNISRRLKLFGCLLISISPSFFSQTLIGYVDTPSIIIFCTSMFIFSIVNIIKNREMIWSYFILLTNVVILYFTWSGYMFIYSIFLIGLFSILFIKYVLYKKNILLYCFGVVFILIPVLIYCFRRLQSILIIKSYGVGEYASNLFIGYWGIFLLVLLLTWKIKPKLISNLKTPRDKIYMFFLTTTIYTSLITLLVQRFTNISIIFLVIYFCLLLNDYFLTTNKKTIFSYYPLFIIIFLFATALSTSYYRTVMNDDLYDAISVVRNDNNSIISPWEYGHLINYIDNMSNDVVNRASPEISTDTQLINFNIDEKSAVKYFDSISRTDKYYLIFDDYEYNKFIDIHYPLSSSDSSIIIKVRNNKEPEYYNILSKIRLHERYFYILERR